MKRTLITSMVLLALAGSAAPAEGRGYLGVTIANIEVPERDGNGVIITSVAHGSAARVAGLEANDKIIAIDGSRIVDMNDLEAVVEVTEPGDRVAITVVRALRERVFEVELREVPAVQVKVREILENSVRGAIDDSRWVVELAGLTGTIGMDMETLSPQLAKYFDVEAGVLVSSVDESTAAHEAGFLAGDILLEVDGTSVASEDEVRQILNSHEDEDMVDIKVQRNGRFEYFSLVLDSDISVSVNLSIVEPVVDALRLVERVVVEIPGAMDTGSNVGSFSVDVSDGGSAATFVSRRILELEAELERLRALRQDGGRD